MINRLFGDTSFFAFLVYSAGQGIAAIVLIYLVKKRGLRFQDIGFNGRLNGKGAMLALAGWFIAFWLYYAVEKTVGLIGIDMFWNESEVFGLNSGWRLGIMIVATLVIAPLAEEMIYRGYVLKALLARFKTPLAAVLSSVIFASIHVGIGLGLAIYIFFGALILAWLYLKFRNIYACVLMHFLNNVVAYFLIPLIVSA